MQKLTYHKAHIGNRTRKSMVIVLNLRRMREMEEERRWDAQFAGSMDALVKRATEAAERHKLGLSIELDPDSL